MLDELSRGLLVLQKKNCRDEAGGYLQLPRAVPELPLIAELPPAPTSSAGVVSASTAGIAVAAAEHCKLGILLLWGCERLGQAPPGCPDPISRLF